MSETWPVVMVTGHRPKDLPDPAVRDWVRIKLGLAAVWLRDQRGCTVGISGMAAGVDTWWAQAVLDTPGMVLHAYVPFPQQPDVWRDKRDRDEWRRLADAAAHVVTVGDLAGVPDADRKRAAVGLLHRRNDRMLDAADAVLAVWDPRLTTGGTASAVRKANLRRMPGVHLNPWETIVRLGLPDVRRAA